jgi:hypothetical protein
MPHRRTPNSNPAVIRTLKTARDTWKNTTNPAGRAISADQWKQLDDNDPTSLLNRLLKESSDVDIAQAAQAPLTTDVAQIAAQVTMFASHFHQVLDMAVARGDFQPGARSYYGRDIGASTIPDLSSYDAVAQAAEDIVTGEAKRQTAEGAAFVPMALPSAADVAALLTQFNTARAASQQAQVYTDQQRKELNALYPDAQALAADICDTVEFFYRKEPDPGTFRNQCSRWGVVYIYDDGTATPPPPPPVASDNPSGTKPGNPPPGAGGV